MRERLSSAMFCALVLCQLKQYDFVHLRLPVVAILGSGVRPMASLPATGSSRLPRPFPDRALYPLHPFSQEKRMHGTILIC